MEMRVPEDNALVSASHRSVSPLWARGFSGGEAVLGAIAGAATLASLQEDWLALGLLGPGVAAAPRAAQWERIVHAVLHHSSTVHAVTAVLVILMIACAVGHAMRSGRLWLVCESVAGSFLIAGTAVMAWCLRNHTVQNLGAFTPLRSGAFTCVLIAALIAVAWARDRVGVSQKEPSEAQTDSVPPFPWERVLVGSLVALVGCVAVIATERFWLATGTHLIARALGSGPALQDWERPAYRAVEWFHRVGWAAGSGIALYVSLATLGVLGGRRAGWAGALAGLLPVFAGVYYLEIVSTRLMPSVPHWIIVSAMIAALVGGAAGLATAMMSHPDGSDMQPTDSL